MAFLQSPNRKLAGILHNITIITQKDVNTQLNDEKTVCQA